MRLTAIFLFAACMQVSAIGISQQVSVNVENAPVKKVFKSIQKQTGFSFFADELLLSKSKLVTMNVKDVALQSVIEACFTVPVNIEIVEKTIVLSLKAEKKIGDLNPRLNLEVPPITVRGRIVNENGEPVIASVSIKGTNRGTTSNANGEFELNNTNSNAVLIISATNIETVSIDVNGSSYIIVPVKNATTPLNEVVVNKGYYSEKRKLTTGNAAVVSSKEIERQPITNPLQALQGRVAGVYINQTSGLAGGGININIRGNNSIRISNENGNVDPNLPLYIIDGVPYTSATLDRSISFFNTPLGSINPLSSINPSDIESITVLKDADATAIYGSRGSNGVVLITTKKGRSGKTSADFDISYGAGKVDRMVKLLNRRQYLDMRYEAFANDNVDMGTLFPSFYQDVKVFDTTRDIDWQKEYIGNTSNIINARAALSGGSANTQFLFSAQYYKETTVFPGDFNFKRGAGNLTINHKSTNNKLNAVFSANYNLIDNFLPPLDITFWAVLTPPVAPPVRTESGAYNWLGGDYSNQFAQLANKFKTQTQNLITSGSIDYIIVNGLKIGVRMGYTSTTLDQLVVQKIASLFPHPSNTGASAFAKSSMQSWIIEPQISYDKTFGDNSFNFIMGSTLQYESLNGQNLSANGYTSDALIENINAAPYQTVGLFSFSEYKYNALYARLNYNYKSKYLINLTARRDGSSRFGPNRQFGNFGSVGAAWILSEEQFFSDLTQTISFAKLRASYGLSGNDKIPPYGYLDTYTPTLYPYQGGTALIPTVISNPDFSWETNKKTEAGLELGLFKDRIFLTTSYYYNLASNQLVPFPLSIVTGANFVQYNLPARLQNSGFEFELASTNINSKKIQWKTAANISIPKSKLISFPGIEETSYGDLYIVGRPLYVSKGYHFTGIDSQTGLYEFEDADKDGSLTEADRIPIEKPHRIFFGGLGNNIRMGRFEVDFLFQFVKQTGYTADYYISRIVTPGVYNSFANGPANQTTNILDRWRKPGDQATYQRYTSSFFGGDVSTALSYWQSSNAAITDDASFIRLKNISATYRLPTKFLSGIHAEQAQVFIHAQNLLTITNYNGDPEVQNPLVLPVLRMITAGIKLTF